MVPPREFRLGTGNAQTSAPTMVLQSDCVLAETGGDRERAAEIVGIDLSTLYRWLRAPPD
jgi:hypothetical protein